MNPLPKTMFAAVLREAGKPMQIEEIRTPRPRFGEVLVKNSACGMCHSDLHVLGGNIKFPLPAVVGHEVAGEIVELGPGNEYTGLEVGMRVAGGFLMPCGRCHFCAEGRDDLCAPFFDLNRLKGQLYDGETRLFDLEGNPIAMYSMGGLAQYSVIPSTSVAPVPEGTDYAKSAILGCAALTAFGAVRRGADLRYGETVAVTAVGGVGNSIVQIAKAMGASKIIAIDITSEKLEQALALGATHTINASLENVREAAFAYTDGKGVDVSFEALGKPETWCAALDALKDGGRMVPIGLGSATASAPVEINRLVRRSQRIIGSYGALTRQDLPEVIRMAQDNLIHYRELVTDRYSLQQANEGYHALETGKIQGRAIIDYSL